VPIMLMTSQGATSFKRRGFDTWRMAWQAGESVHSGPYLEFLHRIPSGHLRSCDLPLLLLWPSRNNRLVTLIYQE